MEPPGAELLDELDELDVLHRAEREAQTTKLLVATEFALTCDAPDPEAATLPGRERPVRLGGAGTPEVAEFAGASVDGRLQLSAWSADRLIADGLDLRFRVPRLFARLTAFEVAVGHARLVARRTRHLPVEAVPGIDERLAPVADGRLPWGRFLALLDAAIIDADPETARERERDSEDDACVRRCRPHGAGDQNDGSSAIFVRGPVEGVAQIDTAVADMAAALQEVGWVDTSIDLASPDADPQKVGQIRFAALLVLCDPARAVAVLHARADQRAGRRTPGVHKIIPDATTLVARAMLYVHLAQTVTGTGQVARVEGEGPISADWVKNHLGARCGFTIRPVLDPLGLTPVDAYEIPDRHHEAVHVMTPADTFPYASRTTRDVETDHTIHFDPHGPPGQTGVGNLGPLTKRHHRIKTHSPWQVRQPFPGIYLWHDPAGAYYLVDNTGTRRLHHAA